MTAYVGGTTGFGPPSWTTAGRPSSPVNGQLGWNSTLGQLEAWSGVAWGSIVKTTDLAIVTPAMLSQPLTSATAQATTSGSSVDFTGIPSWVKRVTISMASNSTNGTSNLQIQIGPIAGVETTNYLGSSSTGTTPVLYSSGFLVSSGIAAPSTSSGIMTLTLQDSATNTWSCMGIVGYSNGATATITAGSKAIAGVLSRLRFTTVNGTDTFDSGSINIMYD